MFDLGWQEIATLAVLAALAVAGWVTITWLIRRRREV